MSGKKALLSLAPSDFQLILWPLGAARQTKRRKKRKGRGISFKFRGDHGDGIVILHVWDRYRARDWSVQVSACSGEDVGIVCIVFCIDVSFRVCVCVRARCTGVLGKVNSKAPCRTGSP